MRRARMAGMIPLTVRRNIIKSVARELLQVPEASAVDAGGTERAGFAC